MGKIRMTGGGGGGTGSDDCTVTAANVLADQTYMGADTDDGVGTGTMLNKVGTSTAATASLDTANSRIQLAIPATGKYDTAAKLYATYATIANLIGLTAAKLWPGNAVLGITSSNSSVAGGTYTPGATDIPLDHTGKVLTSAIIIKAIPSNYYNANTQQTVFSYGSYGVAASLGAYYALSGFNANSSNPAVITSNKGLKVGGASNYARLIFRQAFPSELKYLRFTLQVSVVPMDWAVHIVDPATMLSVGSYTLYKGNTGMQTHIVNSLADKIASLPNGYFLCFSASTYGSVEDYGLYEIILSPTAF